MATISVLPAKLNYKLSRGDDFADVVTIKEGDPSLPVDVSARTYRAQVRLTANTATIVATMTVDMTNAATGEVGYSIPDTTLDDMSGNYVWDFEQTSAGVVRTLMGGNFFVQPDVTKT